MVGGLREIGMSKAVRLGAITLVVWLGAEAPGAEERFDGYEEIKPQIFELEKKTVPDIWALDFGFRGPRYITVDIPGEGRKLIWYMTYTVLNRTGAPRRMIPEFTLVTDKGRVYRDLILPKAEQAVTIREDATRKLYNSVTISDSEIPPTPAEGAPVVRHGVCFWEGIDMKETKAFDIFVTGLSNGYHRTQDPNTKKEVMRRKTLRLQFTKPGDAQYPDPREIKYTEPKWIYR